MIKIKMQKVKMNRMTDIKKAPPNSFEKSRANNQSLNAENILQ